MGEGLQLYKRLFLLRVMEVEPGPGEDRCVSPERWTGITLILLICSSLFFLLSESPTVNIRFLKCPEHYSECKDLYKLCTASTI